MANLQKPPYSNVAGTFVFSEWLNILWKWLQDFYNRFVVIETLVNGGVMGQVTLADGPQLDAFGRLRTSEPTTLFDAQQEYGLDTIRAWDAIISDSSAGTISRSITSPSSNGSISLGGNAVGPRDTNSRMVPITIANATGDIVVLQSRQYTRYIPGKGHLVFLTGVFADTTSASASIVLRTNNTGTITEEEIAQAAWNIDPMDGTGPSGVTINFTKTQILAIQAQWLGVGRVIVGFDVDGMLYPAHQFLNANNKTLPYTQTFNLPIRCDANVSGGFTNFRWGYFDNRNGVFLKTTKTAATTTNYFVCCSVQSEGGEEIKGYPRTTPGGTTSVGVTTRRPVLSIQPAATFNSLINRAHIEEIEIEMTASTNSAYWEIVIGGTLTGAAFATVGADSCAEYDRSATAITGGIVIKSGFVVAGSGASRGESSSAGDVRNPLTLSQIGFSTTDFPATQIPVSLVVTALTGTSNVTSTMNWHEQTI